MPDFNRLTLEEKTGQLFFVGFRGYHPDLETEEILDSVRPGGLVFSQRNVESFDRFSDLTESLRNRFGIPLLMAMEQEGGGADRLRHIFGALPSPPACASLGAAGVRALARIIAAELNATGLNLNLAPSFDLNLPGSIASDRSFSANPAEAARLGNVFIDELSRKNILACAKHFPGMGGAAADPHFVLPRIDRTRKQILQEDILPFQDQIGGPGMIMTGHGWYPAFGDRTGRPASLSPRIVDGLLRKKLGFEGVAMTADLTMGAVARLGLTPGTFLDAFLAGNDMMLFSETTPLVADAFRTLVRAARASKSVRVRLDESAGRILALKRRLAPIPLRYRATLQARIIRQIEKLRTGRHAPMVPDGLLTP